MTASKTRVARLLPNPGASSALDGQDKLGAAFDRRVWLFALGTFAIGTDANVISGILPQLAQGLHVGLAAAGQVVTVYSLTYGFSAPVLAALTARLDKRRLLLASLLIFAAANALCALATSYAMIIAARILAGLAAALYSPTAYTFAASLARPDRKGAALAAVASGLTAALLVGVPLGTFVGQRLGWHGSFWFVGGLSIVAAFAIAIVPPRRIAKAQVAIIGLTARFAPLRDREVLLALLPNFVWCAAIFTTYTYMAEIFTERGFSSSAIVAMFLIFGLGGFLGVQVGGLAGDRWGTGRAMTASLLFGIIDTAAFNLGGGSIAVTAFTTFALAFTIWLLWPIQQSRLLALRPAHSQVVLAVNNSCVYLGIAVGSGVGAAMIHMGLAPNLLHWASSVLLVGALVIVLMKGEFRCSSTAHAARNGNRCAKE